MKRGAEVRWSGWKKKGYCPAISDYVRTVDCQSKDDFKAGGLLDLDLSGRRYIGEAVLASRIGNISGILSPEKKRPRQLPGAQST